MAVSSGRMTELQLMNKLRRDQHREASRQPGNRKSRSDHKVPIVYYISRNGQLDHPHFMELPLSSPKGLFLNDVIGRLNVLRGKGMPGMYAWSCKRSYKNGFVWHDLSDNDFIYPAHGHEYVLKGSELLLDLETVNKPSPENQITTVSDTGYRRRDQSSSSTDCDPRECSVYKSDSSFRSNADAFNQKEDGRRRRRRPPEIVEVRDEIEISPPPSDSSLETLGTLLKADGRPEMVNKESRAKFERQQIQKATKSSVLMQLISCGSLSFKGGGAGQVISRYRMRVRRGSGGGVRVEVEGEQ